jgi:hypothetical protein
LPNLGLAGALSTVPGSSRDFCALERGAKGQRFGDVVCGATDAPAQDKGGVGVGFLKADFYPAALAIDGGTDAEADFNGFHVFSCFEILAFRRTSEFGSIPLTDPVDLSRKP